MWLYITYLYAFTGRNKVLDSLVQELQAIVNYAILGHGNQTLVLEEKESSLNVVSSL